MPHAYSRLSRNDSFDGSSSDGSEEFSHPDAWRRFTVESAYARRRRERLEREAVRIVSLSEEIAALERKEGQVLARLERLEGMRAWRSGPLQQELEEVTGAKEGLIFEIAEFDNWANYANSRPGLFALLDKLYGSNAFEVAMSCVIALNAVEMSLELDFEWAGWAGVESAFLVAYVLELFARLRHSGVYFWYDPANLVWNYLDFIIVSVGAADLWLMPAATWFQATVLGQEPRSTSGMPSFLSLLRLLRVFRLLRLVKLVKSIKPLYRQILGITQSLMSVQWVLVLTLLALYGTAIMWTALLGHKLIEGAPEDAENIQATFGTVPRSLFSLFRLMNGDDEFLISVFDNVAGQMLYAGFMVIANWCILAILTSVVSGNMMSSSARILEEEAAALEAMSLAQRERRLKVLFSEIDTDGSGAISQDEWQRLLTDPGMLHELCDATGLDQQRIVELHDCIAVERKPAKTLSEARGEGKGALSGRLRYAKGGILRYADFIQRLRDDQQPLNQFDLLRMLERCQRLESLLQRRFDEIWMAVHIQGSGGRPGEAGRLSSRAARNPWA